jgi:hypothetical protein
VRDYSDGVEMRSQINSGVSPGGDPVVSVLCAVLTAKDAGFGRIFCAKASKSVRVYVIALFSQA